MADVYFRSACSLMRRHLDDPYLAPAYLAHELSLSERQVYRIFARRDTSFRQELRRLRLQRAAEILTDPSQAHLRLVDIAVEAGFANAAHFSRVFRCRYGCAPSDYRRYHHSR